MDNTVIKLGSVNISFEQLKSIIDSMPPKSTIDYPNAIETLKNGGTHSDEELNNYAKYTIEKSENYKYHDQRITDLFPDSFLIENGFDPTVKRVFVLVQPPAAFVAPHYDQFRMANIVGRPVSRLWVALEDSKFGQALFVENSVLTNFKAGDVYTFDNAALHSTANAGLHNRYTMLVYTTKQ